jgi:hypothetical protein
MSLAATIACGSGAGSIVLPNPSEVIYSNASLKGSYVYQVHGFDTNFSPYRQVGVFTADGNGNITGGSDDSSVNATGTAVTGNYSVAPDGTGFINLNTSLGQISWAITLSSTSKLSLIEADSFANAGGTAELQVPSAIAATLNGTFVFHLHQEASAQNQAPAAEVGEMTISSGSATGSMDENLAGVFSSPNITATLAAPTGLGRGIGTLVNSSTNFTTNVVYYIVDISKFVMLVSNVNAVGSGSAELQSGAVSNGLSGNYAFGSRGDGSFFAGIATVGQISAASGTMTTTEDLNQDGTITSNTSFDSCYTPSASGRVVINDVSGNVCSSSAAQVFWMVNPSRAFFVNTFSIEDGTADLQTSQTFSTSTFSQQYAVAMDGVDTGAIDFTPQLLSRIGTLQFNGAGKLTLNEVANASASNLGATSPGLIAGTYSVSSNGRIVGTVSGGTLNLLVMYAVSPSQAYVLQADPSFITSGTIQLQQ